MFESCKESLKEENAMCKGMIAELKAKAQMIKNKVKEDPECLYEYADMIERMNEDLSKYSLWSDEILDELEFYAQREEECQET